jgi:serine/threonine protein kinase
LAYDLFPKGDLVGNRYRVVRFIARGGMGLVYEVKDVETSNSLALKALKPEVARHASNLKRFRREIRLARKVTHSNVCRIYDAGVHRDGEAGFEIHFLTMELLHGETLAKLISRRGVLPREEAGRIVRQIGRGLHAAHSVGIVHRDLKSSNIILEGSGPSLRTVVTDFGLARSLVPDTATPGPKLTATGQLMGTPAYFAPELLEGKPLTPASDIYSLGVMIYEMVTGRLPFVGRTPFLTALKRLREPFIDPRDYVSDLEPMWVEVIEKCLEREPGKRITPKEIIERLSQEEELDLKGIEPRLESGGGVDLRYEERAVERGDRLSKTPSSANQDEPTQVIHEGSWYWKWTLLTLVLVVLIAAALLY